MTGLLSLIKRNCKLFFKDKGMFISSLITPIILLVLYATFLKNVYRESFIANGFIQFSEKIINATVGGQLCSSLLAVCCVTVSFCSNLLMVQDKVTGARRDLTVSPVKKSVMAIAYYFATVISTLIVCFVATGLCFLYLLKMGWYLSLIDILSILLDVVLLVLFGTALSSIINIFLSTQGQMSAVGTIISAGYGFLCGAYMPISSFSEGLQKVLSFFPGTYGTALVRNHALRGAFEAMADEGLPNEAVEMIKDSIDCNLYFFGDKVGISRMYLILGGTVVLLIGIYVIINVLRKERA